MRLAWIITLTGVLLVPRAAPAFWPDSEGEVLPEGDQAAIALTDEMAARVIRVVAKLEPQMGKQLQALWASARIGHEELSITGVHVWRDPKHGVQAAVKGQFVHVPSQRWDAFRRWAARQVTDYYKHGVLFARDNMEGTDRMIQQVFADPGQGAGEIAIEQRRLKKVPSGTVERMAWIEELGGPRTILELEHDAQMALSVRARHTRNAATLDILHVLQSRELQPSADVARWRHFSYCVETLGPLFKLTTASSHGPKELPSSRGGPQQGSYVRTKTTMGLRLSTGPLTVETGRTSAFSPRKAPPVLVPFCREKD